jgi:lysyl-tRNA synthetase class II
MAKGLDSMRSVLKGYNLIEVFTPILHNRFDFPEKSHFQLKENEIFTENLFLRICMELRLRQLLKFSTSNGVYEIGSCFRKELEPGRICEFHMLELFEVKPSYEESSTPGKAGALFCEPLKAVGLWAA